MSLFQTMIAPKSEGYADVKVLPDSLDGCRFAQGYLPDRSGVLVRPTRVDCFRIEIRPEKADRRAPQPAVRDYRKSQER